MSDKRINLDKTVFELCNEHTDLPKILEEIGFRDITKPGMLATTGRFMTIPKGAAMKKIDLDQVKNTLIKYGYMIED